MTLVWIGWFTALAAAFWFFGYGLVFPARRRRGEREQECLAECDRSAAQGEGACEKTARDSRGRYKKGWMRCLDECQEAAGHCRASCTSVPLPRWERFVRPARAAFGACVVGMVGSVGWWIVTRYGDEIKTVALGLGAIVLLLLFVVGSGNRNVGSQAQQAYWYEKQRGK